MLPLPALSDENFLNLPLEDLLPIEISSASRKVQQVPDVAAAVCVIAREDIERREAGSIPEALRLAPGIEVARIGNNRWAIRVRGCDGRFANKLLLDIGPDDGQRSGVQAQPDLRLAWPPSVGSQPDLWLKYTGRLNNPAVPACTGLDLRYSVRIGREMEIAIVGPDLLNRCHPEFVSEALPVQATEIGRSLMLKATWCF